MMLSYQTHNCEMRAKIIPKYSVHVGFYKFYFFDSAAHAWMADIFLLTWH